MQIYNTMTGKKEEFVPLMDKRVGMYVCGPTVYNFIHIGNARSFIVFDLVRRYLEYKGYDVTYVQNFTDIDDKMIKRANEESISVFELGERFINEYFKDADALGIKRATVHPRATQVIDSIIEFISDLVAKGYAYQTDDGVYFSVEKFDGYGKLSKKNIEDLISGARVDVNERKKNPLDFALWKAAKPGEPCWESPWGKGRPGWHIECSVMSSKYLGNSFDIHGGGPDLVFPHHENEIAQSEARNGTVFARYWMHAGYLNINNQKMSKSLGNFFTVREVLQRYDPMVVRFFMLSSHYRSPINFSFELLDQTAGGLDRIKNALIRLNGLKGQAGDTSADFSVREAVQKEKDRFIASMDDDFNTAEAISNIFNIVSIANSRVDEGSGQALIKFVSGTICELLGVLGITFNLNADMLDEEIECLIKERQEARARKDFKTADRIRDELKERGIILEDTPQGVRWKRK
ncbi:cysteine--tRNA ligase [Calorimonas adulescens]|uniref:Cysteine--tRNA ligase n=1 Tax=Calorimonas adulescens TaxID=2606906 RepID=A0A5D8QF62_9THEO|nr:cysteine--tRNA ligase [Calorimonas adulescens]TZE82829.1 cysteine--tRNA ligase [Calorimonas adulescens]